MDQIKANGLKLLILAFVIAIYLFPVYRVDGTSMEPTYNNGQLLYACRFCKIKPGDVIVFKNPTAKLSVKRVLASEDEKIRTKQGMLTIDGIKTNVPSDEIQINNNGELFLVGDNYLNSYDSRDYGLIDRAKVKAKVLN